MPDDAGGLRFVGTPGAVWGAAFVFFDEVNRCRPDLQNKLFPIVHERRVAGIDLPELRHRWAAMNPPPADEDPTGGYLGAEPLDAALADRFWFVVRVPGWAELARRDREALARRHQRRRSGPRLGRRARRPCRLRARRSRSGADTLVGSLRGDGDRTAAPRRHGPEPAPGAHAGAVGRRRARRGRSPGSAAAVEGGGGAHLVQRLAPVGRSRRPPSAATVIAAHVQAWEVTVDELDPVRRAVLEEPDPVQRIRLGLDHRVDEPTLARLVTGALAAQPTDAHRLGLATVLTRALAEHDLTPAAWAPLADWGGRALRPGTHTAQ